MKNGLSHWPVDTSLALLSETIGELLDRNAARFPDRPAVYVLEGELAKPVSHAELARLTHNLACWLTRHASKGDRIGLWSRNAFESVLLQHACARAGLIITPFNTGWTDAETAHALALVRPALLFAGLDNRGTSLIGRARTLAACPAYVLEEAGTLAQQEHSAALPAVTQGDPFLIQFTSGTTGKAKGALLSQRAAILGGWIRPMLDGANETDLWLNAVPFHHIGGSTAIILGALTVAGAFVVLERYDRDQIITLMQQLRPTRMGGVPTMWHDILASPNFPEDAAIRILTLGGASVPASLARAVHERTGAICSIGYAQSECPVATGTSRSSSLEEVCETIGRPQSHVELKIVDQAGDAVPFGETGEICVRGPVTMEGYWENPEATAATIDPDGFLHTGDLGMMDKTGLVRFCGRLRDVIIRGGENIYPAEIEDVLLSHPAVAMAAVVGVDDLRLGQVVGALVQLHAGAAASTDDLLTHIAPHLARFKHPQHWRFVSAMPMTVSGKIRKVELEGLFG